MTQHSRLCLPNIEGLPVELATAIEAVGRVRILRRSMHRQEHLDQIEAALTPRLLRP